MLQNQNEVKVTSREESLMAKGKWMLLKFLNMEISAGSRELSVKNYEFIERPTRLKGALIDGIEICPILKYPNGKNELLVLKSFRPAIKSFVYEFPGGMSDEGETEKETGERELLEETGLHLSKVLSEEFPVIPADPWKSVEAGSTLLCEIDMGDERNHKTEQKLEGCEWIILRKVPLDLHILANLKAMAEKDGAIISSKIWSFGLGFILNSIPNPERV